MHEELLESLDPEQRAVVTYDGGPLIVLAGAGTGKTRAITHRIAYGAATGMMPAEHVLALTFTAKAAGEMRARIRALGYPGIQARTFHSAALRQLRYFWSEFATGPFPTLLDGKARPLRRILAQVGLEVERETVRDVAAEIDYAAVNLVGIDDYERFATNRQLPAGVDIATMVRILRAYAEFKTEHRVIDYHDVLLIMSGVMSQRPDIAAHIHDQYRHFVVDEFQDVSPIQFDLLGRWLGRRDSLCVVGDPSQTIYTFAGASDSYLLGLNQWLPQARTISLVRNYRSTPPIVAAANRILDSSGRNHVVLEAQRKGGTEPIFQEYPDDASEAYGVAERIANQLRAGVPAHSIAVLFRTNGQSPLFEQALDEAGIHYLVRGGEQFFARPEVRQALTRLSAHASSGRADSLPEVVAALLSTLGWQETGPAQHGAVRQRWESLNALVSLAKDMQAQHDLPVPLSAFVDELFQRSEAQHAPVVDGVTLASVHAAKGLEWPYVHVVGMSEGLMPISYATTPAAIAEERRLFYVAVTRAKDSLTISWSQARQKSAQSTRKPSRFITDMRAGQAVRSQGSRSQSTRGQRVQRTHTTARLGSSGRGSDLGDGKPVNEAVLAALKTWRQKTAAELKVPSYMVFTTATLTAIARLMPTSMRELGQVSGIGPVKLGQFGTSVLDVIRSATAVADRHSQAE